MTALAFALWCDTRRAGETVELPDGWSARIGHPERRGGRLFVPAGTRLVYEAPRGFGADGLEAVFAFRMIDFQRITLGLGGEKCADVTYELEPDFREGAPPPRQVILDVREKEVLAVVDGAPARRIAADVLGASCLSLTSGDSSFDLLGVRIKPAAGTERNFDFMPVPEFSASLVAWMFGSAFAVVLLVAGGRAAIADRAKPPPSTPTESSRSRACPYCRRPPARWLGRRCIRSSRRRPRPSSPRASFTLRAIPGRASP
ncbi:MAG: hypothetical protein M5R36_15085 [Deltaproteobacteria bacterium]|nr:hypothetical protein [Deltaproteobacteria bacterium]